jgi:hypothetical protein
MILQDIKQKFRLVNAYEDWKDYRQLLTDMVIDIAGDDKAKTVAVIGAGYCNDIDIKSLCGQFGEIFLVDCDTEALNNVIYGMDEEDAKKVILRQASLTGIEESNVSEFFNDTLIKLQNRGKYLTYHEFDEILMDNLDLLLSKTYTEDEVMKALPRADIAVCNGVCSQLFSVISYFIRSVAASIPEALFKGAMDVADRAEQRLKSKNDVIIPAIVNAILKSAGDYVIFGNEYSKERPVEGAYQCIEAVAKSGHVIKECEATWSFNRNENIEYNMFLQICKGSL